MTRPTARTLLLGALVAVLGTAAVWNAGGVRWLRQAAELALAGGLHAPVGGPAPPSPPLPRAVAHAGGAIGGVAYSNALEALEANYARGFRAFEVDLQWTRDGRLVLLHDWDDRRRSLFPGSGAGILSRDEFLRLRMRDGLTPLSIEGLMAWLDRHPDARIVTDIKSENERGLRMIAGEFPGRIGRIVPQIYAFGEYAPVRAMGYRDVLLTLYRKPYFDGLVVRFARSHRLAGVVMPAERAAGPLPGMLGSAGVRSFAHTVNDPSQCDRLRANGVEGFFTDTLPDPATAPAPDHP